MDSVYADAPFDHKKADVILRSSDNTDFRIFKLFLSLASPFFQTLFEIPHPADASKGQETKDGLVVIPMAENTKTLGTLLRFCYPCTLADDPELDVLKDTADVLEAARKYSLGVIEKKARRAIINPKILVAEPLRCFAIAHQGRLKEETVLAAKHTLTQPLIPTRFEGIESITAADFLALLTYHKKCGDTVYAMRTDTTWTRSYYGTVETCGCRGDSSNRRRITYQPWETFVNEVFIELRDRPCRETVQAAIKKVVQAVGEQNCQACVFAINQGMRDFSDLLVGIVEQAVSKNELDLSF